MSSFLSDLEKLSLTKEFVGKPSSSLKQPPFSLKKPKRREDRVFKFVFWSLVAIGSFRAMKYYAHDRRHVEYSLEKGLK